jgi:lipopolysaccharide transport system permease protein
MRFDMPNYTFFLLSALFPWAWFSTSVLVSANALIAGAQLIRKVRFPRYVLVVSAVLGHMVNFLLSVPILVVCSLVYGDGPGWIWLLGVPLLGLAQLAVTGGVALTVSALNVHFRDCEYLIGVAINLLFWVTPILYPMERVPERFQGVIAMNPLSGIMEAWRRLFMYNVIDWRQAGPLLAGSVGVFVLGLLLFQWLNRNLDEVL